MGPEWRKPGVLREAARCVRWKPGPLGGRTGAGRGGRRVTFRGGGGALDAGRGATEARGGGLGGGTGAAGRGVRAVL